MFYRQIPQARRGFTVLQTVIVLAIITALAAFSFTTFQRAKASARRAECDVHLKAIALALDAFRQEHGYYPESLDDLRTEKYLPDNDLLSCPSDPRRPGSYNEFYVVRGPRDKVDLPLLVCPFHEEDTRGAQAYIGRYTTNFMVSPAVLESGSGVTVERPGKDPVAAAAGMELHGADRIRTGGSGSAKIVFADGSSATVEQNTDVTVLQSFTTGQTEAPLYTLVRQTVGAVVYQVHKGSKFDVTTPTATAGALGTRFEVRVDGTQETYVQVTEGTVQLATRSGTDIIPNDTWMYVQNQTNLPPGKPPPRPRRPLLPPPPP